MNAHHLYHAWCHLSYRPVAASSSASVSPCPSVRWTGRPGSLWGLGRLCPGTGRSTTAEGWPGRSVDECEVSLVTAGVECRRTVIWRHSATSRWYAGSSAVGQFERSATEWRHTTISYINYNRK